MTKQEYDERNKFTNIYWHIRNQFVMQIQMMQQFEKFTQESFDRAKNQVIVQLILKNQNAIRRFGDLYRKYNMAEHYENKPWSK